MIARSLWESALELQTYLSGEDLCFAFIGGMIYELTLLASLIESPELVEQLQRLLG